MNSGGRSAVPASRSSGRPPPLEASLGTRPTHRGCPVAPSRPIDGGTTTVADRPAAAGRIAWTTPARDGQDQRSLKSRPRAGAAVEGEHQLVAAVAIEVGGPQQAGILAGQVPAHYFPPVHVEDDDPPLAAEFLEVDADPARFPSRVPRPSPSTGWAGCCGIRRHSRSRAAGRRGRRTPGRLGPACRWRGFLGHDDHDRSLCFVGVPANLEVRCKLERVGDRPRPQRPAVAERDGLELESGLPRRPGRPRDHRDVEDTVAVQVVELRRDEVGARRWVGIMGTSQRMRPLRPEIRANRAWPTVAAGGGRPGREERAVVAHEHVGRGVRLDDQRLDPVDSRITVRLERERQRTGEPERLAGTTGEEHHGERCRPPDRLDWQLLLRVFLDQHVGRAVAVEVSGREGSLCRL